MEQGLKSLINQFAVLASKKIAGFFETLMYPQKCLKCSAYMDQSSSEVDPLENCFCDLCLGDGIYRIHDPFCLKCGIQLPGSHIDSHVCGTCLNTPLIPEKVRAVAEYKGIMKEAIPLFKYQSKLSLARVFEILLFEAFLNHFQTDDIDLIIPIPLHRSKLKQRGFNQAYLLIRRFNEHYRRHFHALPNWKVDIHSVERKKKTDAQTGFDVDQRRQNLKNAFYLTDGKAIKDKSILLVDDVLTTGATCNEAAALLLNHGARKIQSLVLARA